jgi:ABC-type uncharacterized transport system substrate-binding protein
LAPRSIARGFAALLLVVLLGTAPPPGEGHPHVFLDYAFDLVFTGEGLAAVQVTWMFDEFFSSMLRATYDRDRDGRFSPDEAGRLEREQFAPLRPFGYYTELALNGTAIPVPPARDFQVAVRDHRVVFTFALPLPTARSREGTLALLVDDPDYYFAMAYDGRTPARALPPGSAQVSCAKATERQPFRPLAVVCAYRR